MENLFETDLHVVLVKGISRHGKFYTAVKIGDSLIFDYRLVQSLLLEFLKGVEK